MWENKTLNNGFGHMTKMAATPIYILSVNEKLPVAKFWYLGKYKIQLFGHFYVHVSGQRQTCLER